MFRRARVRLTLIYIGLFALVLGIFSDVFYIGFATVLAPTFDLVERHLLPHRVADGARGRRRPPSRHAPPGKSPPPARTEWAPPEWVVAAPLEDGQARVPN